MHDINTRSQNIIGDIQNDAGLRHEVFHNGYKAGFAVGQKVLHVLLELALSENPELYSKLEHDVESTIECLCRETYDNICHAAAIECGYYDIADRYYPKA